MAKFEYKNPTIIKFTKPLKVKLSEIDKVVEEYKPFCRAEAWPVETFEYGEFDNWVTAVIESTLIDPKYSKYYAQDQGIFKAGETSWSLVQRFWYFRKNDAFWTRKPTVGYCGETIHTKAIEDISGRDISSIFVISDEDKRKIENGEKLVFDEITIDVE